MAASSTASTALKKLKSSMRASVGAKLSSLGNSHIAEASAAACKNLLQVPQVQTATRCTAFASMEKEVQTDDAVISLLLSGKTVLLPRVVGRRKMAFLPIACERGVQASHQGSTPAATTPDSLQHSLVGLETSKWGIREPPLPEGASSDSDLVQNCVARHAAPLPVGVVIVPCVAFGEDGSRLGHGGGFYGASRPQVVRSRACKSACCGVCADTFFESVEQVYAQRGWDMPWLIVRQL